MKTDRELLELRAKAHAVGKRCLEHAKALTVPDPSGTFVLSDIGADLLVELHGLVSFLLDQVEDIDATIEARVVAAVDRLRHEGKL